MNVIDLFSGLGGFSQAFVDRGHYVERYDFNKDFKDVPYTTIKNVFDMTPIDLEIADIVLASIDCTYFTIANAIPDKDSLALAEKLTRHTLFIIHEANPRFWIIENPPGRIKKILGPPVYKTAWGYWGTPYYKPTWLWGKLPFMNWPTRYREPVPKDTWDMKRYKKNKFSYLCDTDPKKRSLIPYAFSLELCKATEKELEE
jgi:hypothetical protein